MTEYWKETIKDISYITWLGLITTVSFLAKAFAVSLLLAFVIYLMISTKAFGIIVLALIGLFVLLLVGCKVREDRGE